MKIWVIYYNDYEYNKHLIIEANNVQQKGKDKIIINNAVILTIVSCDVIYSIEQQNAEQIKRRFNIKL